MAFILRDHYALFRNYYHWEDTETPYWTEWDIALADALQLLEDYTSNDSGQLPWVDEDEDLVWKARTRSSGYLEAVESYQKSHVDKKTGHSTLPPGDRVTAEIDWLQSGRDDWPKAADWFESKAKEAEGEVMPPAQHKGRPPTKEELDAMVLDNTIEL